MPITEFLSGHLFDRESERVLGIAFEMACVALRTGDRDVKQAITTKLIALATASEAARSSVLQSGQKTQN